MHAGVSKIDMQQICFTTFQNPGNYTILTAIDDSGLAFYVLQPESTNKILPDPGLNFHLRKWEFLLAETFPADHEGFIPPQAIHLPVNVKHFRLEKRGAITGDDRHG